MSTYTDVVELRQAHGDIFIRKSIILDHIISLEKEEYQMIKKKCIWTLPVGLWITNLLGGKMLKEEYRCPVNEDIKKKREVMM